MLSPFVPLRITAIPSYFGLAFPAVIGLSYLIGIFTISSFFKSKFFYALIICSFLFLPRFCNLDFDKKEQEESLSVLSYNLRGGYSIINQDLDRERENLKKLETLLTSDIDIVLIQEMNDRISGWISDYFPYLNTRRSQRSGTLIASNFEIMDSGEIDFGTKVNSCIWADLKLDGGVVRVYNVHFESSHIYEETERAIEEGRDYNPDVFTSMNKILDKHSRQGMKRIKQAELVKSHIKRSKYKVILGGDFNESPMSFTYQIIKEDLYDHFKCGTGYGATYPSTRPLVRIDYIMSSKNIICEQFEILRNISLSDHLPILSKVNIKNISS